MGPICYHHWLTVICVYYWRHCTDTVPHSPSWRLRVTSEVRTPTTPALWPSCSCWWCRGIETSSGTRWQWTCNSHCWGMLVRLWVRCFGPTCCLYLCSLPWWRRQQICWNNDTYQTQRCHKSSVFTTIRTSTHQYNSWRRAAETKSVSFAIEIYYSSLWRQFVILSALFCNETSIEKISGHEHKISNRTKIPCSGNWNFAISFKLRSQWGWYSRKWFPVVFRKMCIADSIHCSRPLHAEPQNLVAWILRARKNLQTRPNSICPCNAKVSHSGGQCTQLHNFGRTTSCNPRTSRTPQGRVRRRVCARLRLHWTLCSCSKLSPAEEETDNFFTWDIKQGSEFRRKYRKVRDLTTILHIFGMQLSLTTNRASRP